MLGWKWAKFHVIDKMYRDEKESRIKKRQDIINYRGSSQFF